MKLKEIIPLVVTTNFSVRNLKDNELGWSYDHILELEIKAITYDETECCIVIYLDYWGILNNETLCR